MTTRFSSRAPFAWGKPRRSAAAWLIVACGVGVLPAHGRASDGKSRDPDLPQPIDADIARPLLERPPFTRMLDLSDTLKLTGIAYVRGRPVATLINKTTKQTYVVSEEPNAMGWRLTGVSANPQMKAAEVRIMVGGEVVSIRYSEAQLMPARMAYMPSRIPTPEEFTGHDEKGAYVRATPYLSDEDRERFRGSIPRSVREKFLNIVHDHRDVLFKASHEERAAFVKKALDAAEGK